MARDPVGTARTLAVATRAPLAAVRLGMPKRTYPQKSASETLTIDQAAAQLGVATDVLVELSGAYERVEALVEHGMSEAEARGARLLASEVEKHRAGVQRSRDRLKEQLEGLSD